MGFENHQKSCENFKYLDNLIHSGAKRIVLNSDVVLNDEEVSEYSNGIKLNVEDLVLDGNGHSIDACGKTRIFECLGKNITIKNAVLKNGSGAFGGAVIITGGDLSIMKSVFSNNFADGFYGGGAIFNLGAILSISCSSFTENSSTKHGGAILNAGGTLSITKSEFDMNSTKNSGGAINNDKGILKISESSFTDNRSKKGGAVNNYKGNLKMSDSSLYKNNSHYGGAINNEEGTSEIFDSSFKYNGSGQGGALNNDNGSLTLNDSSLVKNRSDEGAAINHGSGDCKIFDCEILENQSENNIILNRDSLQAYNTNFNLNKSKYIIFNDGKAKLGIFNCDFVENNAESALANRGKSCAVEKTLFENNNPPSNSRNILNQSDLTLIGPKMPDDGMSISNEGHIVIRDSPASIEDKISGEGEVEIFGMVPKGQKFDFGYLNSLIHENKTGKIILEHDIRLENYERDFFEGGIDLDIDDLVIDGDGKIIDGADKSRIFLVTGKNLVLKNIIFKNGRSHHNYENQLNNDGGALKINQDAVLKIINCEFIKNISEESGGAIKTRGELMITDSKLNQNSAGAFGGAIYNYGGKLKVIQSRFNKNSADMYGGAIDNDMSRLTITNSIFTENFSVHGGAIRNYDAGLTMMSSKLINNQAAYGAAINHREGDFKVFNCWFLNNESENSIILNRGLMQLNQVHFKDNFSEYAIFNDEEILDLTIRNGEFIEKDIEMSIIYNNGKSCTIEETVFENKSPDSKNIANFTDLTLTDLKIRNYGKTIFNEGNIIINGFHDDIAENIEGGGRVEIKKSVSPDGQN